MKKPVRFRHCYDIYGRYEGAAVIDLAVLIGVSETHFLDRKTYHSTSKPCVEIEYGPGHSLYVEETMEEVLWRLEILA